MVSSGQRNGSRILGFLDRSRYYFFQVTNSIALVRKRIIPTERTQLVGEVNDNPYGSDLGFVDWSCYYFFQVAPQFYSRGWVDPFQTQYSSENLVGRESSPGSLDL
jgi:hypothetical protein